MLLADYPESNWRTAVRRATLRRESMPEPERIVVTCANCKARIAAFKDGDGRLRVATIGKLKEGGYLTHCPSCRAPLESRKA